MRHLTIGKLAKEAGIASETIRYYERNGLLPPPDRLPSGYRVYGQDEKMRLRFIREAQSLGFSLAEIGGLLGLTADPEADCAAVNKRAQAKLVEIEQKIAALQKMQSCLAKLSEYCPGDEQPLEACSIINYLYGIESEPS